MGNKAILFPAFVREYSGHENNIASQLLPGFKSGLKKASEITGTDLTSFDFETNNFLNNELKSQYISYIFSCELADFIKQKTTTFDTASGYSMGLYAMFYFTGSVRWEDGLMIIKKAYDSVLEIIPANTFGMGNIIGLDLTDMNKLLKGEEAEIININGSHNFFVSGKTATLHHILEKAKNEGAIHARMLPVGCPYHSKYIRDASDGFGNFIRKLDIKDSVIPAISCIDQSEIRNLSEVKIEIIRNLVTPLNWQQTIIKMTENGIGLFYECGAGISLFKLNKFIPGDHKTLKFNLIDMITD